MASITTADAPCPKCGDTGKIQLDDWDFQQCECQYIKKMRSHLGVDLSFARVPKSSPLYMPSVTLGEPPTIDKTKTSLFLKGWWDHLLGHIKWALICKGLNFTFSVISDERIRTVFVGNESSRARRGTAREGEGGTNGLPDLVENQDLLIVRLGFLGYKNIAMAGALLESLRIREFFRRPTWLVEEPNSIFQPGHFSYSDELNEYIARHFETIDLVTEEREVAPRGVAGTEVTDEDDIMGLERDTAVDLAPRRQLASPVNSRFQREKVSPTPSMDDQNSVLFDGPRKNKFGKKKSSGGGPV